MHKLQKKKKKVIKVYIICNPQWHILLETPVLISVDTTVLRSDTVYPH